MADRRSNACDQRRAAPTAQGARGATPRSPLELGVLDGHLGYFLRRAQVWVFQDFIRTLAEIDIGPAQYSVLVVIGANRGPSQADVAELLGIERARLVRMLDHLEKRGLTQRLPSPIDRRSHALHLTPGGQKLLKRAKALAAMHEARLQSRLGASASQIAAGANLRRFRSLRSRWWRAPSIRPRLVLQHARAGFGPLRSIRTARGNCPRRSPRRPCAG